MRIKKAGGKAYGAVFTAEEKRAMDKEIERQLAEWDKKNARELSSMALWILHEEFGFGHDRLKRFFTAYIEGINALSARYYADEGRNDIKDGFICTMKLKDYGIDLNEWNKEIME